jgi:hypothetical protein
MAALALGRFDPEREDGAGLAKRSISLKTTAR